MILLLPSVAKILSSCIYLKLYFVLFFGGVWLQGPRVDVKGQESGGIRMHDVKDTKNKKKKLKKRKRLR